MGKGVNGNLIPLDCRSKEEAKRIRSMGGKARVKQMQERKVLKDDYELALSILSRHGKPDGLEDAKADADLRYLNLSKYDIIVLRMVNLAMQGDIQAYKEIMTAIGERAPDKVEVKADVKADVTEEVRLDPDTLERLKRKARDDPEAFDALLADERPRPPRAGVGPVAFEVGQRRRRAPPRLPARPLADRSPRRPQQTAPPACPPPGREVDGRRSQGPLPGRDLARPDGRPRLPHPEAVLRAPAPHQAPRPFDARVRADADR